MAVSRKPPKPVVPGMPKKTSQGLGSLATALANIQKTANAGQPLATSTPPPAAPAVTQTRRPIEEDAGYQQQIATAARNRDSTFTDIDRQRGQTLQQFGYTAQFNPDQSIVAGTLAAAPTDPNNPFSRAALLKRAYDDRKRGTETSYAARGQQFAGSMVNANNRIDLENLQSQNAMSSQLADILAGLFAKRRQAGVAFDEEGQRAAAQALARAVQETNTQ